METKPIDKYVDAIISGRTTGYGYIETLEDKWIDILCGFAKETNEENFLNRLGVKNPVNAKDLENWTLAVTEDEQERTHLHSRVKGYRDTGGRYQEDHPRPDLRREEQRLIQRDNYS